MYRYCRIIFFTVLESHIAFYSVLFYEAANYLDPIAEYVHRQPNWNACLLIPTSLYEAFAIVSFFFLFQALIVEDGNISERSQFLTEKEKKKGIGEITMKRFKVRVMIFSALRINYLLTSGSGNLVAGLPNRRARHSNLRCFRAHLHASMSARLHPKQADDLHRRLPRHQSRHCHYRNCPIRKEHASLPQRTPPTI